MQKLWRTGWRSLGKLKIKPQHGLATLLLGMHLKETKTSAWKDTRTVFTAVALPTARPRKCLGARPRRLGERAHAQRSVARP